MRFLMLLFALFGSLYATNLLTYNIYERGDRVDIMLSFDAPYEGNIFQKRDKNRTVLVLNSINYANPVVKSINSHIIQDLAITPQQSSLLLSLGASEPILVNASKTTDGFGLRIRTSLKNASTADQSLPKASVKLGSNTQPQADDEIFDGRYFLVLFVLAVLVGVLFWLKKRLNSGGIKAGASGMGWLIKDKDARVQVLFEKYLDRQNKVVLLSFEQRKFLVLVGSSNVLLDSFGEDKIKTDDEFAVFFEQNKKRLGEFLSERKSSLQSYKDKLSAE